MKRTIITTIVALMGLMSFAQYQEVMIIEKNDNTTQRINLEDIKRIIFENAYNNPTGKVANPIDLGLPSGVKWASWNLGASASTELGGLYGWADPTGQNTSTNINDYPSSNPPSEISGTSYDVAKALWGGNWRLPTKDDIIELYKECTWYRTDGDYLKVVGPNGNYILLPFGGRRTGTEVIEVGTNGYYWSGTLDEEDNRFAYLTYVTNENYGYNCWNRRLGMSVRPVYDSPKPTITVTTGSATNITSNSATVSGTISGMSLPATATILYDTSSSLSFVGSYITSTTTNSSGSFSINLTGLKPNTTYYYQAAYVGDGQNYMGTVKSFTTKNVEANVTTGSVTNITTNSATVSGTISGISLPVTATILYGTSSSLSFIGSTITSTQTNSSGSFSINLTGLKPNTTYYYQAAYVGDGQNYMGTVKSFTTKNVEANVTTGSATNITTNSATVSGTISGISLPATATILYGTSSSLSFIGSTITSTQTNSSGSFSINLTGLKANTTYYYQAVYVGDGQNFMGTVKSFTTLKVQNGSINGHEYVDLGLPSGLKWATCNVGASSPEKYGGYYAWGMTTENTDYNTRNYTYYQNNSFVSIGSDISGTKYDVARAKWGSTWRMPTYTEIQELVDNCSYEWTTLNGVKGGMFTGPNGNSIFIPAAGYKRAGYDSRIGSIGCIWSSTIQYYEYAYEFHFVAEEAATGRDSRQYGLTVRPVSK